jgi:hypothetical protein
MCFGNSEKMSLNWNSLFKKVLFRIIIKCQETARMQDFRQFTPVLLTSRVHSFFNTSPLKDFGHQLYFFSKWLFYNNFIKLSVCVVYKAAGNPITVSVNTGDNHYCDMHISGSITRHTKHDVTFVIQSTNKCKYMSICQR